MSSAYKITLLLEGKIRTCQTVLVLLIPGRLTFHLLHKITVASAKMSITSTSFCSDFAKSALATFK